MATNGLHYDLGPFFSGGSLATSAKLYHYVAGTTTDKDLYSDRTKTTTVAQPLVADANGIFRFFGDGLYKFVITTSDGTTLYTWDNINIAELDTVGEGAALTAAATLTLGTDGNFFHVTGSTGITAISGTQAVAWLVFDSTPTLTHSGNLILWNSANYTAAAGDVLIFLNDGAGVWRLAGLRPAGAFPVALGGTGAATAAAARSNLGAANVYQSGLSENLSITATVATNILTISLKGADGNAPSATNPVKVMVRSSTLTTGTPTILTCTSALTLAVPDTALLGTVNGVAARLWICAATTNGTSFDSLGIFNTQGTTQLYPLPSESALNSALAIGTGSDSAGVLYASQATTSMPLKWIAYIEISEATAGTWATAPTVVQVVGPGTPRSGQMVQYATTSSGAVATGTTVVPYDDTIPQNSEGDQYFSKAITPLSTMNRLQIDARIMVAHSAAGKQCIALFQDSTANALAASYTDCRAADTPEFYTLYYELAAGTTSSTTFNLRAGCNNAGTTTLNGASAARLLGGACYSFLRITEVFA